MAPALDPCRFSEARCDHCGLRRRRAETFVAWHAATCRVRQLGSRCLRDFLDGHDPQRLCRQAEYLRLADDALRDAAHDSRRAVPSENALEAFALHAAHVIRANGWVSRLCSRGLACLGCGSA